MHHPTARLRSIVGDLQDAGSRRPYDPAIDEIRTDRLILHAFEAGDLPAFVAYRSDPGIARYQPWDETYSIADAERFLADLDGLVLGQPGVWVQLALVDPTDGALLGDCACHVSTNPPRTAEIGVTLAPASQGRGLAGEAVRALVTALFDRHRLHRVIAQVDDRNQPAHRLVERLGFRLEARLVDADWFKGEWTTLRVYAVLPDDWRADRPPPR
jgi:RimJ/RimL family protein N-acetyltransferase